MPFYSGAAFGACNIRWLSRDGHIARGVSDRCAQLLAPTRTTSEEETRVSIKGVTWLLCATSQDTPTATQ